MNTTPELVTPDSKMTPPFSFDKLLLHPDAFISSAEWAVHQRNDLSKQRTNGLFSPVSSYAINCLFRNPIFRTGLNAVPYDDSIDRAFDNTTDSDYDAAPKGHFYMVLKKNMTKEPILFGRGYVVHTGRSGKDEISMTRLFFKDESAARSTLNDIQDPLIFLNLFRNLFNNSIPFEAIQQVHTRDLITAPLVPFDHKKNLPPNFS